MISFRIKKIEKRSKELPEEWASRMLEDFNTQEWNYLKEELNVLRSNDIIQVKSTLDFYVVDHVSDRVWLRLLSNGWDNLGRAYDFLPEKEGYKLISDIASDTKLY